LRDGARLVETADDVLEELGIAAGLAAGSAGSAEPESADPDPVVAALTPGEGVDLEVLAARTGLSAAVLLPRLLNLELRGTLRREPGGRFVRLGQTC
jgi:DNA processing protein